MMLIQEIPCALVPPNEVIPHEIIFSGTRCLCFTSRFFCSMLFFYVELMLFLIQFPDLPHLSLTKDKCRMSVQRDPCKLQHQLRCFSNAAAPPKKRHCGRFRRSKYGLLRNRSWGTPNTVPQIRYLSMEMTNHIHLQPSSHVCS